MSVKASSSKVGKPTPKNTRGRLFFLSASSGQVFSANPDGSDLKVIVSEGRRIPDGIVVDREAGHLYWTNMGIPTPMTVPSSARILTDRGDPPRGNTVNRAPMDAANGNRPEPEIVLRHLMEGIGLALDLENGRMFVTDLAGSVYSANLDGSNKKPVIFAQGNLTGIAYSELPAGS